MQIKPHAPKKSVFGGITVVLMGAFGQLSPVGDAALFQSAPQSKKKEFSEFQKWGQLLLRQFSNTIIFDEIMRQQGDDQKRFVQALESLASELSY